MDAGPDPDAPKTSQAVVLIVIVLISAGLIGATIIWFAFEPGHWLNPNRANVSELIWTENGTVLKTYTGFNVVSGTSLGTSFTLVCSPVGGHSQTCNSGTVTIVTSGFRLISTNAPFTWSSGSVGTSASIIVNFQTPSSAYSGNLTIAITPP